MAKRKYPKPRAKRLDKKKVRKFLDNLNFGADEIRQEWRHLLAFGKYKNKPSVFKLATTKKTSNYTRNEHYWNDVIKEYKSKKELSFQVPLNYESGQYENGLFYIICEYFPGESLDKADTWPLKKIAKMAYEIINMPEPSISRPDTHLNQKRQSTGEKLLESSIEWSSQVKGGADKYLKIISDAKDKVKTAPAHGDFTIRQMFLLSNGKIGLIDGEHFGLKGPMYYDPAWFYLRLRIEQHSPNSAKKFLKEFKTLLPSKEQATFWTDLRPVLTQRFIGHLWGAKNNKNELDKLEAIGKEILQGQII